MTNSMPEAPEGATTSTHADGLREIADWLDAHPEIKVQHAFVSVVAAVRCDLEALAEALGDRAKESLPFYSKDVQIEGRFAGGARVYGRVPISKLTDAPPVPEYTPILPATGVETWRPAA